MNDEISFADMWYYLKREGFTLPVIDKTTLLCLGEKVVRKWGPAMFSHLEAILAAYAALVEPLTLYN